MSAAKPNQPKSPSPSGSSTLSPRRSRLKQNHSPAIDLTMPTDSHPRSISNTASNPIDLTDDPGSAKFSTSTPIHIPPSPIAIDETPSDAEDEDADLRRAIALSLLTASLPQQQDPPAVSTPTPSNDVPGPANPPPMTTFLGGLNRAQMEQERLARLKRKRCEDISPPPLSRRATSPAQNGMRSKATATVYPHVPTTTSSLQFDSAGQNRSFSSAQPSASAKSLRTPSSSSTSLSSSSQSLTYPTPTVLKTSSSTHPLTPNSHCETTLPSLLDAANLNSCLLSSFTWDMDWLLPHLRTQHTKFLLVMHAKQAEQREQIQSDFAGIPNVRLCFPPMPGNVNCMHSKLMLLFFENHVRVVVPTANLVPFDWGEDGVMENTVFVVDLPKLPTPLSAATTTTTPPQNHFHASLTHFLTHQTIPPDVIKKLSTHNFSPTNAIRFIHSIGGSHPSSSSWQQTGHPGLGTAITSLGLRTTQPIHADYITSSVGSLTPDFLRAIYLAAQGDTGLTDVTLRTEKKFPQDVPGGGGGGGGGIYARVTKDTGKEWKDNFRFYFPSAATVASARGGPRKAGTICFQARWWDRAKFPKENMRDCVSTRPGLMMHNKILYVRLPQPIKTETGAEIACWAYVGSANLSENAWGHLSRDRETKQLKLICKNWECGVIIPLPKQDHAKSSKEGERLDCFSGTIPVPIQYPGSKFENKRPWFFQGG